MSQLHSSAYPVTNLSFDQNRLYVITVKDSQLYEMQEKNPGRKHLDEKGCAPNCACLSSSNELIVGRSDDVLSYDRETKRVTSHPISGEKFQLISFGRYLVVLTKDNSGSAEKKLFRVTIFSLHGKIKHENKFFLILLFRSSVRFYVGFHGCARNLLRMDVDLHPQRHRRTR